MSEDIKPKIIAVTFEQLNHTLVIGPGREFETKHMTCVAVRPCGECDICTPGYKK